MTTGRGPEAERRFARVRAGGPPKKPAIKIASRQAADILTKSLVAAIPVAGGALSATLSSLQAQRAAASQEELLREMSAMLQRLEDDKLDTAYLRSEEFLAVLMQAWHVAAATTSREKIRLYAAVLVGNLTRTSLLEPESILSILAEMSPGDLVVLRDVWRGTNQGVLPYTPAYGSPAGGAEAPEGIGEDGPFHILRLQRFGLIREKVGAVLDYTGGEYSATATLQRLMRLVADLAPQSHYPSATSASE